MNFLRLQERPLRVLIANFMDTALFVLYDTEILTESLETTLDLGVEINSDTEILT